MEQDNSLTHYFGILWSLGLLLQHLATWWKIWHHILARQLRFLIRATKFRACLTQFSRSYAGQTERWTTDRWQTWRLKQKALTLQVCEPNNCNLKFCCQILTHTNTHAHTHSSMHAHPFYGPLDFVWDYPGEPVPKLIWILLKQETVSGSGISRAICKSAPRPRQITTPAPHHSVFYRLDALPAAQPTVSKHWRHRF